MRDFTEETATEIVLARLADCPDECLKRIVTNLVRHLHAVVREVEPTQEEWILLSDTLGVSMLVDAINQRKPKNATQSTVLGPFQVEGAPLLPAGANLSKDERREPLAVRGRVLSETNAPI